MADWKKSVKLYGARSMTSSEIMIKTPITIAATAAARFSSARPALGNQTGARLSHVTTVGIVARRPPIPCRTENRINLANFNGRTSDG